MEAVTIEEVQQYIGALWLENKIQAKKIERLQAEIKKLQANQNQPEEETKHNTI